MIWTLVAQFGFLRDELGSEALDGKGGCETENRPTMFNLRRTLI